MHPSSIYRSWNILDTLTNESSDDLEGLKAAFEGLYGTSKSSGPNCARCLCLSHPLLDHTRSLNVEYQIVAHDNLWNMLRDSSAIQAFIDTSRKQKCAWPMRFSGPAPG